MAVDMWKYVPSPNGTQTLAWESIQARFRREGGKWVSRQDANIAGALHEADLKDEAARPSEAVRPPPDPRFLSRKISIPGNNPGESDEMEVGARGSRLLRMMGWKEGEGSIFHVSGIEFVR